MPSTARLASVSMDRPRCTIWHQTVLVATALVLLFAGSGQKLCVSGDGTTSIESAVTGCGAGQCGDGHEHSSDRVLTHGEQCTDVMFPSLLTVRLKRDDTRLLTPASSLTHEPAIVSQLAAPRHTFCSPISPHLRIDSERIRSLRTTVILI